MAPRKLFVLLAAGAGVLLAGGGCVRVLTAPIRAEREEKAEAAFRRLASFTPEQTARFMDARMERKLELTAEQRPRVAAANLDHARRLQAIAASADSVRHKARALRQQEEAHEAGLKAALTTEQFARFLAMKEEMRAVLKEGPGALP